MSRFSHSRVPLVTQAHKPKSEDIGYRERRYLIMMGIRVVCFLAAIVMVTQGAGWWAAFPAVGALLIPYFAVVFANGGREPNDIRGFQEYQPNLPESHPAEDRAHVRHQIITAGPGSPDGSAAGPGANAAARPEAESASQPHS